MEDLTDELKVRIRENAHHLSDEGGGPYCDVLAHIYADHVQELGYTNWLDCLLAKRGHAYCITGRDNENHLRLVTIDF